MSYRNCAFPTRCAWWPIIPRHGPVPLSMLVTRSFIAQVVDENPPDFLGDWRFLPMDPRY